MTARSSLFSIEALERRTLLSSAKLIGGVLEVTGNPGASNQISVYISGNGKNVEVSMSAIDGSVWLIPFSRGVVRVKRVFIFGGNLDDTLVIDQIYGVFPFPTVIYGGGGDDTLVGGSGRNVLDGGAGNDSLTGGDWIDTLSGGDGNDTITGNGGRDMINGGRDGDIIDAGAGDDTVFGGDGDDTITGGAGTDIIFAGAGNDSLTGGANKDWLFGGSGTDTLTADGEDVLRERGPVVA